MSVEGSILADEKRRRKEAQIRIIDLIIYLFAGAAGVFALVAVPTSVKENLEGWEWLATAWGIMLIVAGLGAFLGRLTRYWAPEFVALIFIMTGYAVYIFILGVTVFTSPAAWVAICIITGAFLATRRRYVELQIFTTDPPEMESLGEWIEAMITRRTTDFDRKA